MSSQPVTLGPERVEFFRSRGYLSIPSITTAEEIGWLRGVYDELIVDRSALRLHFESTREDAPRGVIEQVFVPERQRPELLDTAYLANARRFAAELLGVELERALYGGLLLIYKPAGEGRDVPWHQDEAYWDFPERCHSLSVWMPLDDVTVESGCMQFLPGSHDQEVLRYRQPPGAQPLVLDEPVDVSGAVACPIPAGGATFHHCRTLHYTGPNQSDRPRRALTTIFHGPRTERSKPLVRARPWRGEP